jgi:MFS family permease
VLTQEASRGPILAVLLAGIFIATMDTAVINVAAPSIRETLGANDAEVQLVVAAYILSFAALLITGARTGDMYGFGRVFVAGAVVFTVASMVCGFAPSALVLIVGRAVQGAGAAFMVAQVLRGIQSTFSGEARTRAIAYYAMALSVGAVAGQVLGGLLIYADLFNATWRPVFLINLPIGLLILAGGLRYLPEHGSDRAQRLDVPGVVVLSAALLLALTPLMLGQERSWPLWCWICLALSLPAAAAFVLVEQRKLARDGSPLVNLPVVSRPPVAWGLLAAGLALGTYFAMLFILALYLQEGLGKTPLYSGLALVSWVSAFGLSGEVIRRMRSEQIGRVSAIGFVVLASAYLGIAATLAIGWPSQVALMALLGVGGLGLGLGRNTAVIHAINNVPDRYAADISGVINTSSQICGVAGIAAFGALYLGLGPQGGVESAQDAFMLVNGVLALTALGAAAAAWISVTRSVHGTAPVAVAVPQPATR